MNTCGGGSSKESSLRPAEELEEEEEETELDRLIARYHAREAEGSEEDDSDGEGDIDDPDGLLGRLNLA